MGLLIDSKDTVVSFKNRPLLQRNTMISLEVEKIEKKRTMDEVNKVSRIRN